MDDKPSKPAKPRKGITQPESMTARKLSAVLGSSAMDGVKGTGLASLAGRMTEIDKARTALLANMITPAGLGIAERAALVSRSLDVLNDTKITSGIIAQALRDQERTNAILDAAPIPVKGLGAARTPEFKIPPNPILKTNELVSELSNRIDRVTDLSAQQIDIQTKQVELIQSLLLESMEGSTTQDTALKAAHRANIIGFISVVVAIILGLVSLFHGSPTT